MIFINWFFIIEFLSWMLNLIAVQISLAFTWFYRFFRLKSFIALSTIIFSLFITQESFHAWVHLLLFCFRNKIFFGGFLYFWWFNIDILVILIIFSSFKLLIFEIYFLLSFSYVWCKYVLQFAFTVCCGWEIKIIYIIRFLIYLIFLLNFFNCFILSFF